METARKGGGLLTLDGHAAVFVNSQVHDAHLGRPKTPGPPERR
ncbi:MAG: hypothetical protein ACJAV2_003036 [Myxococcota bacterium]|jgi:hypothetical protein